MELGAEVRERVSSVLTTTDPQVQPRQGRIEE